MDIILVTFSPGRFARRFIELLAVVESAQIPLISRFAAAKNRFSEVARPLNFFPGLGRIPAFPFDYVSGDAPYRALFSLAFFPWAFTMSISVHVPYALRHECDGCSELGVSATSVQEVLTALKTEQPQLYRNICDETGAVRKHINLFVNESLIHRRDGLGTPLKPEDSLFIMTAVSGG